MTRIFDKYWLKSSIVQQMKERALLMCQSGNFPLAPELGGMKIVEACRAQYEQKAAIRRESKILGSSQKYCSRTSCIHRNG